MVFKDRQEAGHALSKALANFVDENPILLALPRGGVPIANVVSGVLNAPVDLAIARKIGHPQQPEYAIGAVSEDGVVAINEREREAVPPLWLEQEIQRQIEVAREYRIKYWGVRQRLPIHGRTVILLDDGIATGYTMLAAVRSVRSQGAQRVIVAAPVAAPQTREKLCNEADECVFLQTPEDFRAVGYYYRDFLPVGDEEVSRLLALA